MSQKENPYRVLLYYKYVRVENPEEIRVEQFDFCQKHHLKGRILIAKEGINGTVSGLKEDTQAYMQWMEAHPLFKGIEFKVDEYDQHTFLKLHVRVKDEIVRLEVGELDIDPAPTNYVEPEEWREMLKNKDENTVILDARSNYEHEVGRFKDAMTLDIDNFRDLPEHLEELEKLKDKKIYTYCTGGIKCEKVTSWLHKHGIDDVHQLHGGIIRYGLETGGEDFEGSCYVFDQRVVVPVNKVNPVIVGVCKVCNENKTDVMVNCANPDCNEHFLICSTCTDQLKGCCSEECVSSPRRRVFDGRGYYLRGINSKLYSENPDPNYVRMKEMEENVQVD